MTVDRRTLLRTGAGTAAVAAVAVCAAACGTDREPGPGTGAGEDPPEGTVRPDGAEVLARLADVPVGGAVVVTIASGERVVVSQPEEGRVVAFSAVCTHQGCVVEPEDDDLFCPCHGSRFDLGTGGVLQGPAPDPLPEVPVRVDGADVVSG